MAIKYLAGDRIQGTAAERAALSGSSLVSTPQTSWKELDRVTLGSAGADLDTGTFTAKDNIMILAHLLPSSTTACDLTFNADSGSNYIKRFSGNGSSDSTGSATTVIDCRYNSDQDTFLVGEFNNIAGQEKLGTIHTAYDESAAGSGSAPDRREIVAKWINTSNQINRVKFDKAGFTNFASGSELVVLGCDNDEADSGTNFWQELATTTLTSTGDLVDSGTFTAKKYLMVKAYGYQSSDSIMPALQMGNSTLDTGSNYARRQAVNGNADVVVTGQTSIATTSGAGYLSSDVYYIINKSDKEKFVINHGLVASATANSSPDRQEIVGKWTNASAQANRIGYVNIGGGSSDFGIGSQIRVWGSD